MNDKPDRGESKHGGFTAESANSTEVFDRKSTAASKAQDKFTVSSLTSFGVKVYTDTTETVCKLLWVDFLFL